MGLFSNLAVAAGDVAQDYVKRKDEQDKYENQRTMDMSELLLKRQQVEAQSAAADALARQRDNGIENTTYARALAIARARGANSPETVDFASAVQQLQPLAAAKAGDVAPAAADRREQAHSATTRAQAAVTTAGASKVRAEKAGARPAPQPKGPTLTAYQRMQAKGFLRDNGNDPVKAAAAAQAAGMTLPQEVFSGLVPTQHDDKFTAMAKALGIQTTAPVATPH